MQVLYTTTAESAGGRNGKVIVEGSPLAFEMAVPREMGGGTRAGANPEQLFAAGYSACFSSAIQHVLRERSISIPIPVVRITAGIGKDEDGYRLKADIEAVFPGVDQKTADSLIKEAHTVCPYSKATMGNIAVSLSAKTV